MSPRHLVLDQGAFAASFGRVPFRIEHSLGGHALFAIDRLVELSRALPPERVEWNPGSVGVAHDPALMPSNGLSPSETIKQIEDCDSWLVLKHVQLDAEYCVLLEECLGDLEPQLGSLGVRSFRTQGFIFVSSAGATTPLHLDPEHNFLLQVAGSKTLSVFDRADRSVASERDLERFAAGGHRNLELPVDGVEAAESFSLAPGQGLHVPLHAPHFVVNGPEVSISFSVTFQTNASDREHAVLWMNEKARRVGLRPRPVGRAPFVDGLKHSVFRGMRSLKRIVR